VCNDVEILIFFNVKEELSSKKQNFPVELQWIYFPCSEAFLSSYPQAVE